MCLCIGNIFKIVPNTTYFQQYIHIYWLFFNYHKIYEIVAIYIYIPNLKFDQNVCILDHRDIQNIEKKNVLNVYKRYYLSL